MVKTWNAFIFLDKGKSHTTFPKCMDNVLGYFPYFLLNEIFTK